MLRFRTLLSLLAVVAAGAAQCTAPRQAGPSASSSAPFAQGQGQGQGQAQGQGQSQGSVAAARFLTDENPLGAPLPSLTASGAPGAAFAPFGPTVALGSAAPSYTPYPAYQGYTHALAAPAQVAAVGPAPVYALRTQFHAQDELGQGVYGHVEPFQAHAALQDASGGKVGSFSYVGPDGRVVRTDYVADAGGFRAASDALPTAPPPPTLTPEVAAAREQHLAAHRRRARAARPPRQGGPDGAGGAGEEGPTFLLGPGLAPVAAYRPATLTTVAAGQALLYRVD